MSDLVRVKSVIFGVRGRFLIFTDGYPAPFPRLLPDCDGSMLLGTVKEHPVVRTLEFGGVARLGVTVRYIGDGPVLAVTGISEVRAP